MKENKVTDMSDEDKEDFENVKNCLFVGISLE